MTHPITAALIAAMRHSTEPMVLSDPHQPDHPMIAVNPAFTSVTGYPADEALGRNCRLLQGPETDRVTTRRIRGCLAENRGCVEWVVNYRRDGSMFWNLLFLSPVFDQDGALLHYFGNQRDITDGVPTTVPDHVFGKADMPEAGQVEFRALVRGMIDAPQMPAGPEVHTRALEHVVAAARRLNHVTTHLTPAPWSLP